MSVDSSALRTLLRDTAATGFADACETMAGFTRDEAPVDTGATRDSVTVTPGAGPPSLSATLDVPTPQAQWCDEGTGPHPIVGNPLLAFEWQGRTVIVHSVNHPGSTKHVGWFSQRTVTDARWADALSRIFA